MGFFGPSAIHDSVCQTIGRALDRANTLDGQIKRYVHLKQSIRGLAEGVLYSGSGVSLRSFMEGVVRHSNGRLAGVKDFAEQYPAVLQSARHGAAKYLAELSKPRLLRRGFRSSETIVCKKINPLLGQLDKQALVFVSKVGHEGVGVAEVLKEQEKYRDRIHQKINRVFEAERRYHKWAGAGFQGVPRQPRNQRGSPKQEQPQTQASAQSAGIHTAGRQPRKEAYQRDLDELKLAWSSDQNSGQKRVGSLESLSALLKNAAQVNRLTVDALLERCAGVKPDRLNRAIVEKKLMNQLHFAVHPDKLQQLAVSTNKSPAELDRLKEKAHKFSVFLNWMKGA